MLRRLRPLLTGIAAATALAVTAACGLLPDSREAVDIMRRDAAERGIDEHVRFSARSIGGLGTSPHATVEGWRATPGDLAALLALLRHSQGVAREKKVPDLGVSVRMSVDASDVILRRVPDEAEGDMLTDLITAGRVARVTLDLNGAVDVQGQWEDLVAAGDRIGRGLAAHGGDAVLTVSTGDRTVPRVQFRPSRDVTTDLLRTRFHLLGQVGEATAPETPVAARVDDGELTAVEYAPETFDPEVYRPLRDVVPPGTALLVRVGGAHLRAVVGGASGEPAADDREAALRAVVETP